MNLTFLLTALWTLTCTLQPYEIGKSGLDYHLILMWQWEKMQENKEYVFGIKHFLVVNLENERINSKLNR